MSWFVIVGLSLSFIMLLFIQPDFRKFIFGLLKFLFWTIAGGGCVIYTLAHIFR